ncbi:hypothetical protein [Vibrio rotiferianus]|uniref:hypothetical protein n=1 Tax=Vibrio rotiferianus TaxID=190895 RepID=UPI0005F0BD4A|nr:hypothetical protein [Vibrio rotiferianus]
MYLQFVLLTFTTLLIFSSPTAVVQEWYLKATFEAEKVRVLTQYEDAIARYFENNHSYPESLDVLDVARVAEPVKRLVYYKRIQVSDTSLHLTYQKFILAISKSNKLIDVDYLADNQCGDKHFNEGEGFCGAPSAYWTIGDSKKLIAELIALQNSRLNDTSHRFFENSEFPVSTSGKAVPLESVMSGDCFQPIQFSFVSLSCLDIYSVTDGQVFYQYESKKKAILFALLPFSDENNKPHVVVKELMK